VGANCNAREKKRFTFGNYRKKKSVPTQMVGMAELRNVAGYVMFGNCTIRLKVEGLLLKSS